MVRGHQRGEVAMPSLIQQGLSRRRLLGSAAAAAGGLVAPPRLARAQAPAAIVRAPYGAQVGDVLGNRAVVWCKADRAARMQVRWATTESMADAAAAPVVDALEDR